MKPLNHGRLAGLALLMLLGACASGVQHGLPQPTADELRGDSLLQNGHADDARQVFMAATRNRDRPFLAWIGVARASVARGDVSTAEQAVTVAMDFDPGTGASADLIGRTLLLVAEAAGRQGKASAELAVAMFGRAARLEPAVPRLLYHTGVAHMTAGTPAQAVPYLERAVDAEPDDETVLRALLLAYRALDDIADLNTRLDAFERRHPLSAQLAGWRQWAASRPTSRAASRPAGAPASRAASRSR